MIRARSWRGRGRWRTWESEGETPNAEGQMPNGKAVWIRTARRSVSTGGCRAKQVIEIEGVGVHGEFAERGARPLVFGAVPIEFDAVLVGVAEVEGFADAVVGRAFEGDFGCDEPAERVGERGARGVKDRQVIQAGRMCGRGRRAPGFPTCSSRCGGGSRRRR